MAIWEYRSYINFTLGYWTQVPIVKLNKVAERSIVDLKFLEQGKSSEDEMSIQNINHPGLLR